MDERPQTNAERQAAWRERQKQLAADKEAEDRYVAENMKLAPLVTIDGYEAARARQEAYARWRFKAYKAGEVSGL
jgi:hypothetical protein